MQFILKSSFAPSTWKQYQSVIAKWNVFCTMHKYSINKPEINNVLHFLTDLYEKGLGYTSVNTARAALSVVVRNVEGINIGDHPLISRFVKGIGRLRPPKPRYTTTWDVGKVLLYFENSSRNESMNLLELSEKLSSLLAICTAQRIQTLASIKVAQINISHNVSITITDRLKTSKPGGVHTIKLPFYPDKPNICVCTALGAYIEMTKCLRKTDYLFICSKSPYTKASTQTISHWLKSVLSKSGIDINKFKAHSYRHSSTSKANTIGVPIDSIYKSAGWSATSRVFARYYRLPIQDDSLYAQKILES